MHVRQIETFYWIVRLGSFRAAADRLSTTQSTVSMRVMQLEKEIGVALFDRTNRNARLTQKGRALVDYAESMMALTSDIHHVIGDRTALSGKVNLGVSELIALTWLSDLVTKLNRIYPKLIIVLDIDLTANLRRKLDTGYADIVFIPGPVAAPSLASEYLGAVEYRWMGSPQLGIPQTKLTPRDLQKWPIVSLPEQSNLHTMIEEWFNTSQGRTARVDICNSLSVVAALTISGLGVSPLPRDYYDEQVRKGQIRVLDTDPPLPPVKYFATYRTSKHPTIAKIIADLAKETSTF